MIAMNENYMTTNRLEAFYDAIIAIIVTVLVLELPQPATASIESILALKTAYFAYSKKRRKAMNEKSNWKSGGKRITVSG